MESGSRRHLCVDKVPCFREGIGSRIMRICYSDSNMDNFKITLYPSNIIESYSDKCECCKREDKWHGKDFFKIN